MTMSIPMAMSTEVATAVESGRPVVALETSIVAQGMPYPENIETALAVEQQVRVAGAVPASIAVIEGRIQFGLSTRDLELLATGSRVLKLSRADLGAAIARGNTGATTVAATMICARLAGIEVFATGGIGGVHLGAESSFDISQDLRELASTPVIVVSSGAKAILDIPKTLEVLESFGVPVLAFRQDDFPAFWSRSSGLTSPMRADGPAEIVQAFRAGQAIGATSGILVGNPVPREAAIPQETVAMWVRQARSDAESGGIAGKAVTPFLLEHIRKASGGQSLSANIALVKSNAALATEIALSLSRESGD